MVRSIRRKNRSQESLFCDPATRAVSGHGFRVKLEDDLLNSPSDRSQNLVTSSCHMKHSFVPHLENPDAKPIVQEDAEREGY